MDASEGAFLVLIQSFSDEDPAKNVLERVILSCGSKCHTCALSQVWPVGNVLKNELIQYEERKGPFPGD